MKTREVVIYSFDELSEEAKQVALNSLLDIEVKFDWWQFAYEDASNVGLKITGFDLDRNRHADGKFILSAYEVAANILKNHGETCETYKTTEKFMETWQPIFSNYMETEEGEDDLIDVENDYLNDMLEDYSIMLQREYESLTSEQAIIEAIEANGYEFLENGKLF